MAIEYGFRDLQPWNFLHNRVHSRQLGHSLVHMYRQSRSFKISGQAAFCITREEKSRIHRRAPAHVSHVDTRLTQTLHGQGEVGQAGMVGQRLATQRDTAYIEVFG